MKDAVQELAAVKEPRTSRKQEFLAEASFGGSKFWRKKVLAEETTGSFVFLDLSHTFSRGHRKEAALVTKAVDVKNEAIKDYIESHFETANFTLYGGCDAEVLHTFSPKVIFVPSPPPSRIFPCNPPTHLWRIFGASPAYLVRISCVSHVTVCFVSV